ncbi:helix-turn-helix domain-containing protein [Pseudovibrio ascidiaceicola]|uniref:helix-turn-helix domain-containing protein n=1 Tax=Pseudovibrio ascidiaceicola TaxID=285279 RepID=UPI003D3626CB
MSTILYFKSELTGRENYVCTSKGEARVVTQYASNGTHMVRATADEARHMAAALLQAAAQLDIQSGVAAQRRKQKRDGLSPLCLTLLKHIHTSGSISAREAMDDYGITSASLARRMCDLEDAGYNVVRDRRIHPITHQRYTRYSLIEAYI